MGALWVLIDCAGHGTALRDGVEHVLDLNASVLGQIHGLMVDPSGIAFREFAVDEDRFAQFADLGADQEVEGWVLPR